MRCIEIGLLQESVYQQQPININMRCIEITGSQQAVKEWTRLTLTWDVLK